MKVCYQKKNFTTDVLAVIDKANVILREYAAQGYDLTLRQLFYQFVSRGFIPNKDKEYKRLGNIVNDGRLAGLIDWGHIIDRTRNLRANSHWNSPKDIVDTCSRQFQLDKWATQDNYVEVWVEKDALVGLLDVACGPLDVPYFSCRGYTSQSEMWAASQRLLGKIRQGKKVTIIHLGDHDPSGMDMSRDITDRITDFLQHHLARDYAEANHRKRGEKDEAYSSRLHTGYINSKQTAGHKFELDRIALNMDQITQYSPPPNPAKMTDARATKYVEEFGDESWELDALEPTVITALIEEAVLSLRDEESWDMITADEDNHKATLKYAADNWDAVEELKRNSEED